MSGNSSQQGQQFPPCCMYIKRKLCVRYYNKLETSKFRWVRKIRKSNY